MAKRWNTVEPFDQPDPALRGSWSIYAAYSVLMVYFGAASYMLFDWDDPIWYFNAKAYIAFAVIGWLVGITMIPLLDRSSVRRGIQLSLVLSLILHLSTFLGMVAVDLENIAQADLNPNQQELPERKRIVVPDYSPAQIEQQEENRKAYEEIIETDEAKPETEPIEQQKLEHQQPEMQENEVEQDKLTSKVTPEEINRRENAEQQPDVETLEDLPSQLAKQSAETQQRDMQPIEQVEIERSEQSPPELSAANAEASRSSQDLKVDRNTMQVESQSRVAADLSRRQVQQQQPQLNASQAEAIQRRAAAASELIASQARSAEVQRAESPTLSAQARSNPIARQSNQNPDISQPRMASATPSSILSNIPELNRRPADVDSSFGPQTSPRSVQRSSTATKIPLVNSSISDQTPRPATAQQPRNQLQAAAGQIQRQDVGGDGVEANAVQPGQLWAKPSTSRDSASRLLEQHGATRSDQAKSEGSIASDVASPSIGRTQSTGSKTMIGPNVIIEYIGPANSDAAQAEALAGGANSPNVGMGRTAEDLASGVGGNFQGSQDLGSTPSDLTSGTDGISRRESGDLANRGLSPEAGPLGRSMRGTPNSPIAGTQADATGTGAGPASPPGDLAGVGQTPGLERRSMGSDDLPITAPGAGRIGRTPSRIAPGVGGLMRRTTGPEIGDLATSSAALPSRSTGRKGPLLNTKAAVPTDAFSLRAMRKGRGSGEDSIRPTRKTEVAIERGLEFLARYQSRDGRWGLRGFVAVHPQDYPLYRDEIPSLNSDTASTGLALLAFLGAAYDHLSDKYQDQVGKGIKFLVRNQQPNGDLYIPMDRTSDSSCKLYSHGIAALALCEAYGMTQDPALREPAQRAINFIQASQDPELGGWRYTPGQGSDTSVTGWMTMALKSGQLAGLDVKQETFRGINRWVNSAESRLGGRTVYVYNPLAPDTKQQRHGRQPTPTMTAVGALIQLYLGNRRDSRVLQDSASYLKENLPTLGTAANPQRDTYYWYYATQVMFHMRGDYWEQWDGELHEMLEDTQVVEGPSAGSWDPHGEIPDRWGGFAGRIYVTTMNLLSLEVYYRHLPLYDDTAR